MNQTYITLNNGCKIPQFGLSNFESERLEEVIDMATIKPAVLQVECHPYYPQDELKKRVKSIGTVIEPWYPIGHGDSDLINEPIFSELAKKYNKTNVQIILRWHIQEGNVIFPKTTNLEHMKSNIDIFDFELTDDEMKQIKSLNKGIRFFNMSLEEQEDKLGSWEPED